MLKKRHHTRGLKEEGTNHADVWGDNIFRQLRQPACARTLRPVLGSGTRDATSKALISQFSSLVLRDSAEKMEPGGTRQIP